ncbi:MAG: PDZ domain-containing protein [Parvularculaceae bacterium]|nr:PDZ domain-containing protein [Parvularculaceae bacterium]
MKISRLIPLLMLLVTIPDVQAKEANDEEFYIEVLEKISRNHYPALEFRRRQVRRASSLKNEDGETDVEAVIKQLGLQDTVEFVTPEALEKMGERGSVGLVITKSDTGFEIIRAETESPAAVAGIKRGDTVVAINGRPAHQLTEKEAKEQLKGDVGVSVELKLKDGQSVTLVHETINDSVIVESAHGTIGVLKFDRFSFSAMDGLSAALSNLEDQGVTSFVIDLRSNTGGTLNAASDTADLFLSDGVIGKVDDRWGVEEISASSFSMLTEARLAILVSHDTALGAEFFVSAVRQRPGTVLIGEVTAGLADVRTPVPLERGKRGALIVRSGQMFRADGTTWAGTGLSVDIEVDEEDALAKAIEYLNR